jgi:RNA polymerase sigma factor (TIGR02999 family)
MATDATDITQLLAAWRDGDRNAIDRLMPLIYGELRAIARRRFRDHRDHTLQTTALVHETYLKLAKQSHLIVHDRHHFLAVAARAMRQLTVDYARKRLSNKRGGGVVLVPIEDVDLPASDRPSAIVALDGALERLMQLDEELARIVELRYFGGLSVEETAAVLQCSPRTVKRGWRKARALLHADLVTAIPH